MHIVWPNTGGQVDKCADLCYNLGTIRESVRDKGRRGKLRRLLPFLYSIHEETMLPVSFRLPMEAALRIAQLAEQQGLSIGTFIRTQVLQAIDRPSDIHSKQKKKAA